MAIQIGKYKRPGIFIEEFDRSVISSPIVEGITNLVIGVSKKGPVNTPVRVTTIGEFEAIFGQLDRGLERKGSFFHRTISKMLETTPIFAMNLLLTDDNLDVIEYKSLSSSSGSKNDIKREGPYRRFFDTTGFWKRDTESFINLTKNNIGYEERAFNITNLSDRDITVFIIKSQRTGFDRTLLEWYGSVEKMPPYVNANDFASDYMVDVVVVGGDWSNYQELAVSSRWSAYFNASGLRKEQIRNFANDRNITLLAYYEGLSLIPYFRDLEGRNIFIETTINRDTDRTGLFCSFNNDLVEKDFYTGLLDLVGNTLVDQEETDIEFLSYKDTITETVALTQTPLDLPGNVTAMLGGGYGYDSQTDHAFGFSTGNNDPYTEGVIINEDARTAWFAEGSVFRVNSNPVTFATQSFGVTYSVSNGAYIVSGNQMIPVSGTVSGEVGFTINTSDYPFSNSLASYYSTFVVNTSGEINLVTSLNTNTKPSVSPNDIVLGYIEFNITSGQFSGPALGVATFSGSATGTSSATFSGVVGTSNVGSGATFEVVRNGSGVITNITIVSGGNGYLPGTTFSINGSLVGGTPGIDDISLEISTIQYPQLVNVNVDASGFLDYSFGTASSDDYFIEEVTPGVLKFEFPGTSTVQSVTNYEQYRKFKLFNRLVNLIDSPNKNRMTMLLGPSNVKYSLENVTISNIVTSTNQNKSFTLTTGLSSVELSDILGGYFVLYTEDNEFLLGKEGVRTTNDVADGSDYGVVGRYSRFYSRYFDGLINTKDYFLSNRLYLNSTGSANSLVPTTTGGLGETVNIVFVDGEEATSLTSPYAGYDYVLFYHPSINLASAIDFQTFEKIQFPGSELNKGAFTIVQNAVTPSQTPAQLATALGYTASSGSWFAYQVNEEVEFELLTEQNTVFDFSADKRHYLRMFLDGNGVLEVDFLDKTLEADSDVNTQANISIFIQSEISNFRQTVEIEVPTGYIQVPNKILVNADRYSEVKVGDFLKAYYNPNDLEVGEYPRKLTRVLSKRRYEGDPSLTEITCDSRIFVYNFAGDLQTTRYLSVDQYSSTYKALPLRGFRIRQASLPDGTETRQNQILNLVAKGTPLFKAVTNKEAIDFRYLIDSFGLGLTERSKQQLVDICGDRLDAFGFLNMPSLRQFKNSSSPSFVNSEGVLQTSFIASGGDPESNPAFLYSFGEGAGTTCVGYFTPWVVVNDNGRPLDHPPAPFVATTYMRKHISNIGNITPWTIAAGVTNGRITNIVDLEMMYTPEDIENLNQAQMNPLVFKRNRGHVIETENTAQTLFRSALSYIHVREVLIELERELSAMLLEFQWKFNTPDVRSEIKLRADVICETYVSKNGLYNYFNKMDDENNTPEIIDNQIGVLDTYVEPIKGMGIIVNNITILRTGAISAGGFINS